MNKSRPASSRQQNAAIQQAVRAFLQAIGAAELAQVRQTPQRVADLWQHVLLDGQHQDLSTMLGRSLPATSPQTPIVFGPLPIHMICPHHLTIAWGQAWLGYNPAEKIVGLSKLSALVRAATARLILQEEATYAIVETIQAKLTPKASWVRLLMHHPCHWLHEPGAQQALLCTEASLGSIASVRILRSMAQEVTLQPTPLGKSGKPKRHRRK